MPRLKRTFFARPAHEVAPALIGTRLVRCLSDGTRLSGVVVEVEAYIGIVDRASHAYAGRRTARNEAMYGRPGNAYVYFTYGMHHCVNVVCAETDVPEAVLVRALEPDEACLDALRRRRGVTRETLLCSGPGRLCQALCIDRTLNGADLCTSGQLWLESVEARVRRSIRSPRIGIDSAGNWAGRLLRWSDPQSPHLSRPAHGKSSVRGKRAGSKNRKTT